MHCFINITITFISRWDARKSNMCLKDVIKIVLISEKEEQIWLTICNEKNSNKTYLLNLVTILINSKSPTRAEAYQ